MEGKFPKDDFRRKKEEKGLKPKLKTDSQRERELVKALRDLNSEAFSSPRDYLQKHFPEKLEAFEQLVSALEIGGNRQPAGQIAVDEINPEDKDVITSLETPNEDVLVNHPSVSPANCKPPIIKPKVETAGMANEETPSKKTVEVLPSTTEGAVSKAGACPRKYFLIHNSWSNKVLDVKEDDAKSGAALIIYRKKDPLASNQLWYMDENGYIVSKLNGFYIDTADGTARLRPRGEANVTQHWKYHEDDRTIRNEVEQNKVLHIKWGIRFNGTRVIQHKYRGRRNQRWELSYTDVQ